jgi:hypothetical protein
MLSDRPLLSHVLVSASERWRKRASSSAQVPAKVEKLVRVQLCAFREQSKQRRTYEEAGEVAIVTKTVQVSTAVVRGIRWKTGAWVAREGLAEIKTGEMMGSCSW